MTTTRRRVLLIEDETLIAMLLEDILDELGYEVAGVAAEFDDGMRLAETGTFDLAILDVNVGGREIFPIAEKLAERNIPFMFSTGYGVVGLPMEWQSRPVLAKPFRPDDLEQALNRFFPV
ncbi:response regulator receiver domain-containing protein [Pseudomonas duriflava]|uniref:Response regulator receiver domain-containing protein n=1 Tax=Pseudomonas duriflava TaxID=459528 RepID=A0A562Q2N3_9PSED|nr:response regulator [Pseudomonas duriflava]TWI50929.1 response regulator receiver domain-containing protein [Pseudomonas duriflava]